MNPGYELPLDEAGYSFGFLRLKPLTR